MTPYPLYIRLSALILFFAFILSASACGRTIPAIEPELLSQKKSILLITGASLTGQQSQQAANAALETARKDQIALETVTGTQTLTSDLSSKIKSTPFDAVIVAGEELFPDVLALSQEVTGKRFLLLQSGIRPAAGPAALPPNVSMKGIGNEAIFSQWDEWVKLQKAAGMNIVWVTRTSSPVPAAWAPSEEADAVLQLDAYGDDQWFNQLSYQTHRMQAGWIALYSEVDAKTANKIKTLRIPVMDMSGGTDVSYNWGSILPQEIAELLAADWKGGTMSVYTPEQVSIQRK